MSAKKRTPRGQDKQPRRPRNTSPKQLRRRRNELAHAIIALSIEARKVGLDTTGMTLQNAKLVLEVERDLKSGHEEETITMGP